MTSVLYFNIGWCPGKEVVEALAVNGACIRPGSWIGWLVFPHCVSASAVAGICSPS